MTIATSTPTEEGNGSASEREDHQDARSAIGARPDSGTRTAGDQAGVSPHRMGRPGVGARIETTPGYGDPATIEEESIRLGTYELTRDRHTGDCSILKDGFEPLDPRLNLVNYSPTGFEWGYGGSGPAQTALALLADALENLAVRLHQDLKWELVAHLDRRHESWTLQEEAVLSWVARKIDPSNMIPVVDALQPGGLETVELT